MVERKVELGADMRQHGGCSYVKELASLRKAAAEAVEKHSNPHGGKSRKFK
jgi:hypothetical protein